MSKSLSMVFLNQSGKKVILNLNDIKENATDSEVVALMGSIIDNNIFITAGGDIMSKDSAHFVNKTENSVSFK